VRKGQRAKTEAEGEKVKGKRRVRKFFPGGLGYATFRSYSGRFTSMARSARLVWLATKENLAREKGEKQGSVGPTRKYGARTNPASLQCSVPDLTLTD